MKRKKSTTGSLTFEEAKELLKNPPKNLDPNVKDLLDTMCKARIE